jgi:hypothetical protein
MHQSTPKSDLEAVEPGPELALLGPTHQSDREYLELEPKLALPAPVHHSDPNGIGLALSGPSDQFDLVDIEPEPDIEVLDPIHEPGTVRRHTGNPQTFYDWVLTSSNQAPSAKSEPFPSLIGPAGDISASSTYSRPISSRAGTTAPASRPGTRSSFGVSSLRDAVLGAAEPTLRGGMDIQVMESKPVVMDEPKENTKMEENEVMRGYTGAWP